jgi:PPOX class probable F420-dependent enzyme
MERRVIRLIKIVHRHNGGIRMGIFDSEIGQKVYDRLNHEIIIWLTTVDSHNTPQPRPVWFHWDGQTVLIFSQKEAAKLRHLARNPRVSLNFNTDGDGDNVSVIVAEAKITTERPAAERLEAYLKKYKEGIERLGMTLESMEKEFSVAILVTPLAVRGF